jgi:uncharacterized membrane protein
MKKSMLFVCSFILVLWACTHKMAPAGETPKEPKKTKAITYSDVRTLVESKCTPCHIPSQGGFKTPLNSYSAVTSRIDDILFRVQLSSMDSRFMPFKKPSLSSGEIKMLKEWKEAGMAQN